MKNEANLYINVFNKQKQHQLKIGNSTYKERVNKLFKLKVAIEKTYKDKIQKALYKDFKKPFLETDLTEIYPIVSEIKHVKSHLKSWMRNQKVATPLTLLGSTSWIKHEPKGVCLIISPWNFPLNLTFGPLISAIAAGNTVIIKPSEITPNISSVMSEIIADLFDESEIAIIEGEVDTSKELLKLPFNHIFFTGAPEIGKIVMKAAAEHLTSVTLELGGKSPTIIDETANIKGAAKKIVWGKFLNNGQICVSPDYLLVHENIKENLVNEMKLQIEKFYSKDPSTSQSYCRIVNERHFNRLKDHLIDAKKNDAIFEFGGNFDIQDKYIQPTIISNLPKNATLLKEEIFGPILPIITYKSIQNATEYINSKDKPLALYIYSKNKKNINYIINNSRAGTTCINNNVVQYSNHNLPFGGSNNSGIGKSHGKFGFEAFSNKRAVLKQHTKGITELLFPPYNDTKQKLIDFTIKWI